MASCMPIPAGDYGGPMFLMPGMVIALYTCGALDKVCVCGLGVVLVCVRDSRQSSSNGVHVGVFLGFVFVWKQQKQLGVMHSKNSGRL